jgi:DNA-binding MarR family transcriptional regulator
MKKQDYDIELYILMGHTIDLIRKSREKELVGSGITSTQAAAITAINEMGGVTSSEQISKRIMRERHTVHELLGRMEKVGLVEKLNVYKRKNRVKVVLTNKGHKASELVNERKSIRKIMASLSDEQSHQLKMYFKILFDAALKEITSQDKVH